MKKKLYLFLICNLIIFAQAQEKSVRGAIQDGFFSEVLRAINHIEFCIAHNKKPVIYWGEKDFCYYSKNGYNNSFNGWEYYFEPVSDEKYRPGDFLHIEGFYKRNNNFSSLWRYCQYIDNLHLLPQEEQHSIIPFENNYKEYTSSKFNSQRIGKYPVGATHLYDKTFRKKIKSEILDPFISIKQNIADKITEFYLNYIKEKKTIGIHLRGGHISKVVLPVPVEFILKEANKYADEETQFFIATDQEPLLEKAKEYLKGTVIYYPCERFNATTSPYPGIRLHPKLGEDVLIEALLLSQCDHFIHTLSNLSTTVLYFNPELSHTLIY